MKKADIIAGIIGILIGTYAIVEGTRMPTDAIMKIGPSFFPILLASFLILFSVILILNAFLGRSKGEVTPWNIADKGVQRGLITLIAGTIYCVLMAPLGFIISSILFLVYMMWMLGNRKPLTLATAPPIITISTWLLFEKVLNLSLPPGLLENLI